MATNYKIVNSPGNLRGYQNKNTRCDSMSLLPKWSTYGHNRNEVWMNIVQVKFTTLATEMRRFWANCWPNQRSFHAVNMHTGARQHHQNHQNQNSTPKEFIFEQQKLQTNAAYEEGCRWRRSPRSRVLTSHSQSPPARCPGPSPAGSGARIPSPAESVRPVQPYPLCCIPWVITNLGWLSYEVDLVRLIA